MISRKDSVTSRVERGEAEGELSCSVLSPFGVVSSLLAV